MALLIYDGTFQGFLTVVHTIYTRRIRQPHIKSFYNRQGDLFIPEKPEEIKTDYNHFSAMRWGIKNRISEEAYSTLKYAFHSEAEGLEELLYHFIRKGFRTGAAVLNCNEDKSVEKILKYSRRTSREFRECLKKISFTALDYNLLYSSIESASNLLPLLASHFTDLFCCDQWIIHDIHRGTALLHKPEKPVRIINYRFKQAYTPVKQSRDTFTGLYKEYFILLDKEARKSRNTEKQNLPKKYRKQTTGVAS